MFVNVFYPSNRKNIAKLVTILKLCERSFKWDLAECPSFIRSEMALEWRQVIRNLKINFRIFMFLLCCNIETKRIELKIRSWRHFKENSKLFNLIMDIMYLWPFWVILLRETLRLKLLVTMAKKQTGCLFYKGLLIDYKR